MNQKQMGKAGGLARAAKLTPEQRSAIASEAATARWGTKNNQSNAMLRSQALHMWANYIETNNVNLSAVDAKASRKEFNTLTLEQIELVIRLRRLADRDLTKDIK